MKKWRIGMKFRKIIKGATNPRGQEYKVLCPFHQDRTEGSFSINGNTGLYNCYSCGAKGNIYGYVKQVYPEFENSKNREIANFVNQIEGYEAIPLQQFNRYNGEVETIVNSDFELLMQNISFRKSFFVVRK